MLSDAERLDPGEIGAQSYEVLIEGYPTEHDWRAF
jgi:hypothetical protein